MNMNADSRPAPAALLRRLRRYAETLVHSSEQADKVVGQAMDRVLREAAGGQPCETKSFAAVGNLCRDRQDDGALALAGLNGEPIDGVPFAGARQSEVRVRRNFEQLTLDEREVLLLVCVEGFSYGKAAQILNVTKEKLVERLVRARFLLHRRVAEEARLATLMPLRQTGVTP